MDHTERKITKIAREASKLAVLAMKEDGIGTAEYDFIHAVHPPRHHPGGAAGAAEHRQGSGGPAAARLEAKGYLVRRDNPQDGRSQLLYATEQAQGLRNSKAQIEAIFMNGCWQNCRRRSGTPSARP